MFPVGGGGGGGMVPARPPPLPLATVAAAVKTVKDETLKSSRSPFRVNRYSDSLFFIYCLAVHTAQA